MRELKRPWRTRSSSKTLRDVAEKLGNESNVTHFVVEAENFESIHNHSAYAYLERKNEGGKV